MTVLTYQSLKSGAIDAKNMNDQVIYFDEMPMQSVSKDGQEWLRFQKMLMTQNMISSRTMQFDDSVKPAKRVLKETISHCITTFIGSTNQSVYACMDKPMLSRWHIKILDQKSTADRNVSDVSMSSMLLKEQNRAPRKKLNTYFKTIQAIVFELEKLIKCGAISDVSMHVSTVILSIISHELDRMGLPQPSTRTTSRINTMARINCILDAIDTTWFTQSAPFKGKPIRIEDFRHLDRKLFCNCHHIVAAIGECIDLFGNIAEMDIKRSMKELWKDDLNSTRISSRWEPLNYSNPKAGQKTKKTLGDGKVIEVLENDTLWINNYNYCNFPYSQAKVLADRIHNNFTELYPIPRIKHSPQVIMHTLSDWTKRMVHSQNYIKDPKNPKRAIPDVKTPKTSMPMARVSANSKRFFVHYSFLVDKNISLEQTIEDIIMAIFECKNQKPHRFMWTPHPTKPNVRNVLEVLGERDENPMMINIPSVIEMNKIEKHLLKTFGNYDNEKKRDFSELTVDVDLNDYGLFERNELLKIDKDRIDPQIVHEKFIEELISQDSNIDLDEEQKQMGFFMGKPVAILKERGKKLNCRVNVKKQKELLKKLDEYKSSDINGDYDFDEEHYKCPDGRYHWQVMAQKEYDKILKQNPEASRKRIRELREESIYKVFLPSVIIH